MKKTEKGVVGVLATAAAILGLKQLVGAAACTLGSTKCDHFDKYECSAEGKWVLVEANSPECGWTPGEAEFEVTNLVIEPATVYVGEPVSISVVVTNIGGKPGTKTVVLEVS